jgi:SAM-dependent methyltransferase
MHDPTSRFSGRADAYEAARPSYPPALLDLLAREGGLRPGAAVCDLGSGTGIFTRLLLASGATVYAVEPNDEMRAVAERALGGEPRFQSLAARAEATTLPDASVDLVTAAQAFHWFDPETTRRECARILRPGGPVALVWNDRDRTSTPLHVALEALFVAHCPSYPARQGRGDATHAFDAFFGAGRWARHSLENAQRLDREGLVARIASTSFAPDPGTPARVALEDAARALFDRHAEGGAVTIAYEVVVILGPCQGTASAVTVSSDSDSS